MGLYILGASIFLQLAAAVVAGIIAWTTIRPPWILIASAILLMSFRRVISFYQAILLHRSIDPVTESVALLISILLLGGLFGILLRGGAGTFPSRDPAARAASQKRRKTTDPGAIAALLGILTILGASVVVYYSYTMSRSALIENIFSSNLSGVQALSTLADSSNLSSSAIDRIEIIGELWDETPSRYDGSYLCIVDSDSNLLVHTGNPSRVGDYVGDNLIRDEAQGISNVSELLEAQTDWVGWYVSRNGEKQVAAFSYVSALSSMVAVHVPAKAVEREILLEILPLGLGLLIILAILLPAALGMIYRAYRATLLEAESSEERYRVVVEDQTELICRHLPDGTITFVNGAYCRYFKKSSEELVGRKFFPLIPEENHSRVQEHFAALGPENPVDTHEHPIILPDGEVRWMRWTNRVLLDDAGKAVEFQGTGRDITERMRAEEALLESAALNRAILEAMPDLMFRLSRDGARLDFKALNSDVAPENIIGNSVHDLLPKTVARKYMESIEQAFDRQTIEVFEYELEFPEGEERSYEARLAPCEDQSVLAVVRDITERKRAEEKATRFSRVLEDSLNEIYIFDAESLCFTEVNRGARLNLGYTADELKSLTPLDLKPDFTAESFAELLQPLRDGAKNGIEFEAVHFRKDGTHYPVEVHLQITKDPAPVFVAIILDITERKRAHEALTERERHFRLFSMSTGDSFWNWDMVAETVERSSGFERIFGYSEQEIDSSIDWWTDRLHPGDKERVLKTFEEAVAGTQSTCTCEYRFRCQDDSYAIVEDHVCLIRDATGKVVRSLGAMRDITERKQAEADKEEYYARSIGVVKNSVDSIITIDDAGLIESVNPAGEGLFGYEEAELIGQNVKILMPEPHRGNHDGYLDAFKASGVKRVIDRAREVEGRRKDGTKFPMRLSVTEVKFGARRIFAGIIHDLTHERELEQQLLRAQKFESLGTLAAGIAHNLNNVLTPILMAIAPLRKSLEEERANEILDTVQNCAERGSEIVKQVLAFSKESEGTREQFNPLKVVMEVRSIISETFPKAIHLQWEISENVAYVFADPTHLHQVLLNLCLNARDAMPEGGELLVRIENAVIDQNTANKFLNVQPGDFVLFRVKDTGQGISRESLDRIFDPFFTTKAQGEGTGLGLATVASGVKSLGGFIDVTSEVGQGSEFWIYIPVFDATMADVSQDEVEMPKSGRGQIILVVDDEVGITSMARRVLETGGYQVLTACGGEEGKELFETYQSEITLLLTDIMMPRMDGRALIRATRALHADLKVVAISGLDDAISMKSGIDANETITKPFDADELLRVVGRALSKS